MSPLRVRAGRVAGRSGLAPGRGAAAATLLVSAGLLSSAALYNGYPFVFADSRHYVEFAFTWESFWARPGAYSVFLRALHWKLSLWPVVLGQALILSHLVYLTVRAVAGQRPGHPAPARLARAAP